MTKRKAWFLSSLVLVLVSFTSSIFTLVHAASVSEDPNYYMFNFVPYAHNSGEVITTEIDNKTLVNNTYSQTMTIVEKFKFSPFNYASPNSIVFNKNIGDGYNNPISVHDLLVIPIRISNNMIDYAEVNLKFTNFNSTKLLDITQYQIYKYSDGQYGDIYKITTETKIKNVLERGDYIDICVVVNAVDVVKNMSELEDLYFNLEISMKKV